MLPSPQTFSLRLDLDSPQTFSLELDLDSPQTFSLELDSDSPQTFSIELDLGSPQTFSLEMDSDSPQTFSLELDFLKEVTKSNPILGWLYKIQTKTTTAKILKSCKVNIIQDNYVLQSFSLIINLLPLKHTQIIPGVIFFPFLLLLVKTVLTFYIPQVHMLVQYQQLGK